LGRDVSETWHITLVHGTFGRNAAWTRPGSALREHLEGHLGRGRVVYHRFRWSGLPSHLARVRAARRLRARLLKCVQNNETAHHCVISHSHGGNIVCYALRDAAELIERLDCIITLSTPFLSVRSRNLSPFGILSMVGSVFLAIFGSILLGYIWALEPSTPDELFDMLYVHPSHKKNFIAGVIVAVILGFTRVFYHVAEHVLARWRAWLEATLRMPDLVGERLLIVRSFADEANALLVAAQFFEIVVSMFWVRRGVVDRALLSLVTWFDKRLEQCRQTRVGVIVSRWMKLCKLYFHFWALALVAPMALVQLYIYWTQPDVYAEFFLPPRMYTHWRIWGSWALLFALLVAPFTIVAAAGAVFFVIMLACGATIGLFVIAANICLSLVMLVVVPELGPMAFVMAISAEPVPGAGIFRVLQITPQHKIGMVETRFHSTTYSDLAALDAMAAFITQRHEALAGLRQL
jgi:hypothetical protein